MQSSLEFKMLAIYEIRNDFEDYSGMDCEAW
jgi:hypothetical protein